LRSLVGGTAPGAAIHCAAPLPRPAVHRQATVAVARDAQETHGRGLALAPRGQRELPPQALDRSATTLGLDGLAKLLVDRADLRRTGGGLVADGGQSEQVGRQLGTV